MDMPKTSKSSTATKSTSDKLPNAHSGPILFHDFIEPMQLSQNSLARAVMVPLRRTNEIELGKRAITADTHLGLCKYFGLTEGFFQRLKNEYDLMLNRIRLQTELTRIHPRAV
jgi:antitoxin HigA-1